MQLPLPQPQWEGDLLDDCSALWSGLLLRAEEMDEGVWWWAVSREPDGGEIDSSNNYELLIPNGDVARRAAETAARRFFNSTR
jgi:hypothetical protein